MRATDQCRSRELLERLRLLAVEVGEAILARQRGGHQHLPAAPHDLRGYALHPR